MLGGFLLSPALKYVAPRKKQKNDNRQWSPMLCPLLGVKRNAVLHCNPIYPPIMALLLYE